MKEINDFIGKAVEIDTTGIHTYCGIILSISTNWIIIKQRNRLFAIPSAGIYFIKLIDKFEQKQKDIEEFSKEITKKYDEIEQIKDTLKKREKLLKEGSELMKRAGIKIIKKKRK